MKLLCLSVTLSAALLGNACSSSEGGSNSDDDASDGASSDAGADAGPSNPRAGSPGMSPPLSAGTGGRSSSSAGGAGGDDAEPEPSGDAGEGTGSGDGGTRNEGGAPSAGGTMNEAGSPSGGSSGDRGTEPEGGSRPGDAGSSGDPGVDEEAIQRGEALAATHQCATCHQDDYGGLGFYPNITPHPTAGIGAWSDEQIAAAIREGVDADGASLCGLMTRYALSDDEVADVIAFLRSLSPSDNVVTVVCPGHGQ